VGALLDHLGLEDITLVGLSMGGYFALRAAAFAPRVKRVIATGHAFDYRKVARAPATAILVFFHDHPHPASQGATPPADGREVGHRQGVHQGG
jgi:pimeloyl-ACP methyl ester carboxylesterase